MKIFIRVSIHAGLLALAGCTNAGLQLNDQACLLTGALLSEHVGIRNGDPVPTCAADPIVFISTVLTNGNRYDCTGTLVRKDAVLTAAHCVADPSVGLSGTNYVTVQGKEPIESTSSSVHPGYHPSSGGSNGIDIAVIFLSEPVTTVSLPQISDTIPPEGAGVIDYGYGYDGRGPDGNGNIGTLFSGTLSVVGYYTDPAYTGAAAMGILAQASTAKSQETCDGDSGGPLVYNGQIVGVLSGGDHEANNCLGSTDSAYTSIAAASDWLSATLVNH